MLTDLEVDIIEGVARSPQLVKTLSRPFCAKIRREYYRLGGRYVRDCECTLHDVCVFVAKNYKNHDEVKGYDDSRTAPIRCGGRD